MKIFKGLFKWQVIITYIILGATFIAVITKSISGYSSGYLMAFIWGLFLNLTMAIAINAVLVLLMFKFGNWVYNRTKKL